MPAAHNALETALDASIAPYMKAMNAPGLTLGLVDTNTTLRTAAYGYSNLDLRAPVWTINKTAAREAGREIRSVLATMKQRLDSLPA